MPSSRLGPELESELWNGTDMVGIFINPCTSSPDTNVFDEGPLSIMKFPDYDNTSMICHWPLRLGFAH
jgi:hypothetical protein